MKTNYLFTTTLATTMQNSNPTTVKVEYVLNAIKNGSKKTDELIQSARNIFKQYGKSSEYKKFRTNNIPVIMWGCSSFNKKRSKDSVNSINGFIYADFDNCTKEEVLNENGSKYIYALWNSISETGCGGLIKIEGLTKENYSTTYNQLQFLFSNKLDPAAKDICRCNFLSKDENLYLNLNAETYEVQKSISPSNISPSSSSITQKYTFLHNEIKKNNADIFYSGEGDYTYYKNGIDIIKTYFPKYIKKGKRRNVLLAYLSNFFALNPNTFSYEMVRHIIKTNENRIEGTLEDKKIEGIYNTLKKQIEKNELHIHTSKRKIIFSPEVKTKEEKLKLIGQAKVQNTISLIDSFFGDELLNIEEKVTYKTISQFTGLSEITIKKRLTIEHKEFLKEHNSKFIKRRKKEMQKSISPSNITKEEVIDGILSDKYIRFNFIEKFSIEEVKKFGGINGLKNEFCSSRNDLMNGIYNYIISNYKGDLKQAIRNTIKK